MKVAVLSASYGDYDTLKELPPQTVQHEAIFVTDNPALRSDTWKIVVDEDAADHPNLAAKRPKMCPWKYTGADVTIWVDASLRIMSSDFVEAMCGYKFAQFPHPDRDCIYQEIAYSTTLPKYGALPLEAQAAEYRQRGHPEHWGLWACGVIVRRREHDIEKFGDAWLAECHRWGYQDQVSHPPILRDFELRPETLPGSIYANPWLQYEGSPKHA